VVPPSPPGQPPGGTLLTDLVLSWGKGGQSPTVLRLDLASLSLAQHFPALPPREAYGQLLLWLLRNGATALPSRESLEHGSFRRYPDVASLDEALYGSC